MGMELPTRSFDAVMSCQTPSYIVLVFSIFKKLFPVIIWISLAILITIYVTRRYEKLPNPSYPQGSIFDILILAETGADKTGCY